MRFSIGNRLFLAALSSVLAVAAIGVELARWKLFDNFSTYPASGEPDRLEGLLGNLSARYREHDDWSFLPTDAALRRTWFRQGSVRLLESTGSKPGAGPIPATLGYRIGLLDDARRYLAGAVASPFVVAFASIDTIQRAVVADGRTVGYLVVARPQNPDDELAVAFLIEQQGNLLIVAAVSVLLSALAAALLAAHFRKPITQLVDGARRLGAGQFDSRVTTRRSDELGELADTFNRLAATLDDTERGRRQWVADTSHELRTPLAVLRAQMEGLQDGIRTATPENIALMLRQVASLTRLIDQLYELARADIGQLAYDRTASDVWPIVRDTVDSFAERFRAAGLAATIGSAPARSVVACDTERIRQVMVNLLENCARYTAGGGRIEINGSVVGEELHIAIDDSAPGVPEPALGRLGERFFRVEASRSRRLGGAGLGLALSRQILHAHAGRLEFGPSALGGLRAIMVLRLESVR